MAQTTRTINDLRTRQEVLSPHGTVLLSRKFSIVPATPWGDRPSLHSPYPVTPASVSTNVQGPPAGVDDKGLDTGYLHGRFPGALPFVSAQGRQPVVSEGSPACPAFGSFIDVQVAQIPLPPGDREYVADALSSCRVYVQIIGPPGGR